MFIVKNEVEKTLRLLCIVCLFFPQLAAGLIERAPGIAAATSKQIISFSMRNVVNGLKLFTYGII